MTNFGRATYTIHVQILVVKCYQYGIFVLIPHEDIILWKTNGSLLKFHCFPSSKLPLLGKKSRDNATSFTQALLPQCVWPLFTIVTNIKFLLTFSNIIKSIGQEN